MKRAVLFLMLLLLAGCASRPMKLYEGEYLPASQVAVVRSDSHTIIVSVDSIPVREHVSIDTKGELKRRRAGDPGEPFELTSGPHVFEVGYVGWEPVPDTQIVLEIGGTTYTYARQAKKKQARVRYFRSTNKRTFTLTVEAGKAYVLTSKLSSLTLPPLPEQYLRTESDPLEGLRKAREAELQLDFPVKLDLEWTTMLEKRVVEDRQ